MQLGLYSWAAYNQAGGNDIWRKLLGLPVMAMPLHSTTEHGGITAVSLAA
jgi:hypothetical protein